MGGEGGISCILAYGRLRSIPPLIFIEYILSLRIPKRTGPVLRAENVFHEQGGLVREWSAAYGDEMVIVQGDEDDGDGLRWKSGDEWWKQAASVEKVVVE